MTKTARHISFGPLTALALPVLAITLQGCNTTGCTDNRNSVPLAQFRSSANDRSITVDSMTVAGIGAPGDSLLLTGRGSEVYLPFRSTLRSTSFRFVYKQKVLSEAGIADTVSFTYEAVPHFVSEECGAMYYYRIHSVSHTSFLIDSVGVADSLITNIERPRIFVYFRTSEAEEEPAL